MGQRILSKLSSETISALRFPLIVGIVFIHFGVANGVSVQGVEYGANTPYWLVCVNNFFSQVLARIGVPLFFVMSGYLFFCSGLNRDVYKKKLKRRVSTLLVPYILWNAIFIIYEALKSLPMLRPLFPHFHPANWSFLNIIGSFWDGRLGIYADPDAPFKLITSTSSPLCVPMWYVRNLMIAVLLAPILYYLIKKMGWLVVIVFGLIWAFVFPKENYILMTAFFFSWGACLAIKGMDFVGSMQRFRCCLWLYPIIAVVDMLTKKMPLNDYIHNIGIFVGIFAAVLFVAWLLEKGKIRVSKFLTDASFFVFAAHTLLLGYVAKVILKLCGIDSPIYMAVLYFVVPAITIAICLGVYWLLRRYTPKLCALLTGGR